MVEASDEPFPIYIKDGNALMNSRGGQKEGKNRTEFAVATLRECGLEGRRVFYNSLSTPFFVSERLTPAPEDNVLFWQEGPRPDVPGNMQFIFDGHSRTQRILVQSSESYDKLISLGASRDHLGTCGFAYAFERDNSGGNEVLICTNSDQIEGLGAIVRGLPKMNFNIAAITEMSSKLMAFGSEPNVRLYPVASKKALDHLFKECDWYLDINYGSEIASSVKRAFLNNQLILGFAKTLHQRRYSHGRIPRDLPPPPGVTPIRRVTPYTTRHRQPRGPLSQLRSAMPRPSAHHRSLLRAASQPPLHGAAPPTPPPLMQM